MRAKLGADDGREEVLDGVYTLQALLQVDADSLDGLTVVFDLPLLMFGEGTVGAGLHPRAWLGLRRRLAGM